MAVTNWEPFLAFEGIEGSTDKNGIESIAVPIYVPTLALARTYAPKDILDAIGLPVTRRSYRQEWGNGRLIDQGKDGAYKLTLGLEGVENPKEGENGVQFDGDGTASEEDAASHPDLPYLLDTYEGRVEDNKLIFEPVITEGEEEVKNPLFGFKKWYVPGVIWTKTYVTLRPSSSVTQRLGKIDTPPTAPGGYIPQLAGRRNWLKVVGKPSWKGNVWKVTESWLMSAAGGWVEDVYR